MEETQERLEAHTEAFVKSMLHIQEEIGRKDASGPSQEKNGEPMHASQLGGEGCRGRGTERAIG